MVRGVVELVAQYHGMRPEILLARTRVRDVMDARQVAMYVARRCTTASLVLIGRIHGRHHSTVIHDIRAVQNRIDTIPGYGRFVEGIEKAASRRTGIHAATVRAIIHRADRGVPA
jgi:chromosomal replication initiator protein